MANVSGSKPAIQGGHYLKKGVKITDTIYKYLVNDWVDNGLLHRTMVRSAHWRRFY